MFFVAFYTMQFKHKALAAALILIVLAVFPYLFYTTPPLSTDSPTFSAGTNPKIKTAFLEVWKDYKSLHSYGFEVVQMDLTSSTMEARPVIDLSQVFGSTRQYRLHVAEKVLGSGNLYLSDLPEEVLRGWFAHELGHIIDYENHSNAGMIAYGIRYSLSDEYKREREHEADSIAIRHGFKDEIIVTKKYLMESDFISQEYQDQLRKYYMSVQGAELCPEERIPVLPKVEL